MPEPRPPRRFHGTLTEIPDDETTDSQRPSAPQQTANGGTRPPPQVKYVPLTINKVQHVKIPVTPELYAQWLARFKNNTPDQRDRVFTLKQLMEAAYLKGVEDSRSKSD